MNETLAIMLTTTTYGTWLRGDARGWVEDGITYPADPHLEAADRRRMRYEPFRFRTEELLQVGQWLGESLRTRLRQRILAITVQTWHLHVIVAATAEPVSRVMKCIKDAVRWNLRADRPIWTDGYDKRFCFDEESLRARVEYVERHNLAMGWPAQPWEFIEVVSPHDI
jgi:hypothetical protein